MQMFHKNNNSKLRIEEWQPFIFIELVASSKISLQNTTLLDLNFNRKFNWDKITENEVYRYPNYQKVGELRGHIGAIW